MSGAYSVDITPGSTTIIPLPPPQNSGVVKFNNVFVSVATDFEQGLIRLAIGKPNNWKVEDNLVVPIGRAVVRQCHAGDEIVSVIQKGGGPMSVLVEYD